MNIKPPQHAGALWYANQIHRYVPYSDDAWRQAIAAIPEPFRQTAAAYLTTIRRRMKVLARAKEKIR